MFFFVFLTSGLNEKSWSNPYIHTYDMDGGIVPTTLLYSDCRETTLLLECTDQHCSLLPAALIEWLLSDRMVEQKPISRLTFVQPHQQHVDSNFDPRVANFSWFQPCESEFVENKATTHQTDILRFLKIFFLLSKVWYDMIWYDMLWH